ncbi:MAG: hypothetical protein FWH37_03615 [Candidatus Bathyarchaeota archaeon]|nr:hypothetical protein [Candidatus Termiticorpusculum sp.]
MTRQWQLMRDAQIFLDASKIANDALIGIHFAGIARQNKQSLDKVHVEKINRGINLLKVMSQALEAREEHQTLSTEALYVLYVLSEGRKVSSHVALKKLLKVSIVELEDFKNSKVVIPKEAEEFLEIIANLASEKASNITSKVNIFMVEAR